MSDKVNSYDVFEHLVLTELHSEVEDELGSGCFGDAYLLEKGTVAKYTESYSEAIHAARLIGKEHDNIANIYSVISIANEKTGTALFIIEQEFLDTEHGFLDNAQEGLRMLEDNLLSVYDYYDEDDLNAKTAEFFRYNKDTVKSLEQIQDGLNFHNVNGNQSMDVHDDNLGVKIANNGEPQIAIFDQMNLGLERSIKKTISPGGPFNLSEYLQDEQLTHIKEFNVNVIVEEIIASRKHDQDSESAPMAQP